MPGIGGNGGNGGSALGGSIYAAGALTLSNFTNPSPAESDNAANGDVVSGAVGGAGGDGGVGGNGGNSGKGGYGGYGGYGGSALGGSIYANAAR